MPAPVDTLDELGTLIRDARARRALTQRTLAEKIGFSQNYTSSIETGTVADVGALLLGRLSEALDLPIEQLSRAASVRAERAKRHDSLPSAATGNDITITDIAQSNGGDAA